MKKTLALVVSLLLVAALLIGCGGNTSTQDDTASADTSSAADSSSDDTSSADSGSTDDTVYKLTVQTHDPATSATGLFLEDWASRVEEASGGRIDLEIYHGGTLGSPKDTYDLVMNGTCDIGFGLVSYFPGVFTASEAISLPLIDLPNASVASNVFWHLYSDYDFLKDEYADAHVLLLFANCQSPISTKGTKIETVDQISGMNIRGNSGPPTSFITNLGAAPVSVSIGEVYTAIDNNTIDAVITDWHAISSFQLYEPLEYYLDANIGVSGYFLLMNQDSFSDLPEDLQQIMDEYSGEACLEYCGQYWIDAQAAAQESAIADGDEIYSLSDEEQAKLQAVADQTIEEWIASQENGQEIYDALTSLIAEYNQ